MSANVTIEKTVDELVRALFPLRFGPPVAYVYNPLAYAGEGFRRYVRKFGHQPKEILLVGMNPGPWGMAQTGIPFGEIAAVKDWMGIEAPVKAPAAAHPKKPVDGFECPRSEASGRRLWGWARDRFGDPAAFFSRFFVANYCPLMFLDAEGRNRTPDKLKKAEKAPLFAACDAALRDTVRYFKTPLGDWCRCLCRGAGDLCSCGPRCDHRQNHPPQPGEPTRQPGLGRPDRSGAGGVGG